MAAALSTCTEGELAGLIASLDAEFIFARARSLSLASRFPGVLSRANLGNIFVIRDAGRIVASLTVKRFRWIAGTREYAGAMIGMVWVESAKRGSGLGLHLLSQAGEALRDSADFAVLWTAQPQFYARAGWTAADCASLGEMTGSADGDDFRGSALDFAVLRPFWRQQTHYAVRDASWQTPLPLPARALEMFSDNGGCAIAGRSGGSLYCYEMLGDSHRFGAILERMRASCQKLFFNQRTDSAAYGALATLGVNWQPKPLAMWLTLKRDVRAEVSDWYIPWLDRI